MGLNDVPCMQVRCFANRVPLPITHNILTTFSLYIAYEIIIIIRCFIVVKIHIYIYIYYFSGA